MFDKLVAVAAVLASAGVMQPRETIISDPASADWLFVGNARVRPVDAAPLPGGKALLVTVATKPAKPWEVQARMKLKEGFATGDTLTFGFYARTDKPDPGKDVAVVGVRIQRGGDPYDAAIESQIEIGREWKFHCLTGVSKLTLPAELAEVSIQMGGDKHAVAFGPWMTTKIAGGGASGATTLPCGQAPAAT